MMSVLQNFNKKKVFVFITLAFLSLVSFALPKTEPCTNYKHETFDAFFCDLCGCSTSGGSFGLGTLNNASFLGMRYIFQKFESKDGIFNNSPTSTEYFDTYQIWGRIPISDKFYVSAILPYQNLKREFTDRNEKIKGLGDVTIMGWYKINLFKKIDKEKAKLYANVTKEPSNHSLEIGLGAKLPTGKFDDVLVDRVNPGFQLGTGSFDGIFAISHGYGKEKIGVSTTLTYYLKGENKNNYRFGNQFSYASNFFYKIEKEKYIVLPFVGVSGNLYNKIEEYNEKIPKTDGNVFNGTFGAETTVNKFIFGANYTFPISHNLFGGNVTPKQSFTLYLNFSLD